MSPLDRLKRRVQPAWRRRRMRAFVERLTPAPGCRVVDLGGTPDLWDRSCLDLEVTLVNVPDEIATWPATARARFTVVAADACAAPFADRAFDIAFCNSLIEHLPADRAVDLASAVRRLAPRYWVQTPAKWFPLEAHCNLPFWWAYPPRLRQSIIRRWRRRGLMFRADQMATTRAVALAELRELFPEARVFTERVAGIAKSHCVYRP